MIRSVLMKGCVRLVMVCYFLLTLKPVMPIIMDVLAHAFWENVHLATVHVVNGKEHVHYELRRAANGLDKEKAGGKYREENDAPAHLAAVPFTVSAPVIIYGLRQYPAVTFYFPSAFGKMEERPPKA